MQRLVRRTTALAVGTLCLLALPAAAEPSKSDDIDRLLNTIDLSATADGLVTDALDSLEKAFRRTFPRMPADAMAVLMGEMEGSLRSARPELVRMLSAMYAREYTHDEIRALLDFYRTPLGRKVLRTTPRILRQGARLTDLWTRKHARTAGRIAMRKIEDMGYDPGTFGR